MVKPEKFGHLHLVYHFTVPLSPLILSELQANGSGAGGYRRRNPAVYTSGKITHPKKITLF